MSDRKVAIRLGTEGAAEVKGDLKAIGDTGKQSLDAVGQAGEAAARRAQQAFDRASTDIEAAQRRQAAAAAKLATIQPKTTLQSDIEQRAASGSRNGFRSAGGIGGGSARDSASAFRELLADEQRMEAKANAIKAALDPLAVAQARYNDELQETQRLQVAGLLTTEQAAEHQRRLKIALDQSRVANDLGAESANRNRAAYQQLGFQLNDVVTQLSSGQNPITVFAQQGPQIAQAFALMGGGAKQAANDVDGATGAVDQMKEGLGAAGDVSGAFKGKLAAFGSFLSGPWGAALMGGVTILGLLISNMSDAGEETDELKLAQESLSEAQRTGVLSADALKAATIALDEVTGRTKKTTQEARVEALLLADARLKQASADNAAALAAATLARTRIDAQRLGNEGRGNLNAGLGISQSAAEIAAMEARIAKNDAAIADATKAMAAAYAPGNFAGRLLDRGGYEARIGARPDIKDPEKPKEDKSAEKEARELQSALEGLESQFDPTAAAARKYAEVLADIEKLEKSGKLNAETATSYRVKAALEQFDSERRSAEEALTKAGQQKLEDGRTIEQYLEQVGGGTLIKDEAIDRSIAGLDKLGVKTKLFADEFIDLKAVGTDALQSILDVRKFEDFGRVGSIILDALRRKFLELALVNPLTNVLNGFTGDKALPTIFSIFKGGRASGDEYFGGGLAVVGEFGRELVSLPRGSRISSATQTRRMMEAANDRGGPMFNFDLRGAVMTESLLQQMNAIGDSAAVRGAAGGAVLGQAQMRKRARFRMA